MLAALATSDALPRLLPRLPRAGRLGALHRARAPSASLYFAILLSHTVLAAAIVPLVLVTLARALRGRFDAHRRIARYTLPLWLWVSVSGVVVYWMLYRL